MDVLGGVLGAVLGALAAWQTKPKNVQKASVILMMALMAAIGFVLGAFII